MWFLSSLSQLKFVLNMMCYCNIDCTNRHKKRGRGELGGFSPAPHLVRQVDIVPPELKPMFTLLGFVIVNKRLQSLLYSQIGTKMGVVWRHNGCGPKFLCTLCAHCFYSPPIQKHLLTPLLYTLILYCWTLHLHPSNNYNNYNYAWHSCTQW